MVCYKKSKYYLVFTAWYLVHAYFKGAKLVLLWYLYHILKETNLKSLCLSFFLFPSVSN